ncbi:Conserved oligomeric Golgi complex subunit [Collariella sp. IMI 366227]|nr:Conserved oligomeric Golgi complex subunit [Collariella sp. IMI 366227]
MDSPLTPNPSAAPAIGPRSPSADEPSYIDYEAFLSPSFTAPSFANTSNRLHIDHLTTRSALPLLTHTSHQTTASTHILSTLQSQLSALSDSYAQLEREVVHKHAEADLVRLVAQRGVGAGREDYRALVSEEVKGRTVAALTALYLLTPVPVRQQGREGVGGERWAPTLMLQALEALATLPSLERTLAEVSARCQNVVALEAVLEGAKVPAHPLLSQGKQAGACGNMLQLLLAHLETGSLASYFWRTMANSMAPRVQEIVAKGGVSARTLRTNRQSVGEAIKECVARGSQLPSAVAAAAKVKGKGGERDTGTRHWEREVAVMVGSIVNNLGR